MGARDSSAPPARIVASLRHYVRNLTDTKLLRHGSRAPETGRYRLVVPAWNREERFQGNLGRKSPSHGRSHGEGDWDGGLWRQEA